MDFNYLDSQVCSVGGALVKCRKIIFNQGVYLWVSDVTHNDNTKE